MNQNVILTNLSKLRKKFPVDIEFQNLSYSVHNIRETKEILHFVNGKFRAGELTGILGASGSGKTTLVKILVGYIMRNVTGSIKMNDTQRQTKIFHKLSAFIMQEDLFQPFLSVRESMMISATLKLGDSQEKYAIVDEILQTLGLTDCSDTRVERLSGGQRKRLSIALELVDNPPVIFLDEPTSGLDFVSAKQCINVLRTLADQGKTIICTIHQPSVSIFEKFDQTYFLADGRCVYNGSPKNMLSFLEFVELPCPLDYNPAEHVIEITQVNPETIEMLCTAIRNGKLNERSPVEIKMESTENAGVQNSESDINPIVLTSSWSQLLILLKRTWLQQKRNKISLLILILTHIFVTIIFSCLYYNIGNDASHFFSNYSYYFGVGLFLMYNYTMLGILLMPTEIEIVKREYFNRWYTVKAYFFALTLKNIPMIVILGFQIMTVTYILTGQPMEWKRFSWFYIVNILVALISESFGILVGSVFYIKNGSAIGAIHIGVVIGLAMYGLGYGPTILLFWRILTYTSFLRLSITAICLALLQDRPLLDCYKIFCLHGDANIFLRECGMINQPFAAQIVGLVFFLILYKSLTVLTLQYRLNKDFSSRVNNFIFNLFKCKR